MRVLVTGGAGFIGSALVRYLIRETAHEVLNVDSLTYAGNPLSLSHISRSDRYQFSRTDIRNRLAIENVISDFKPQLIMHLAAETHVDRSIRSSMAFIELTLMERTTFSRLPGYIGKASKELRKTCSAFTTSRPTKFTVRWAQKGCSPKTLLMPPTHPTQLQKPAPTISFGLGMKLMGIQRSQAIARTTMGLSISRKIDSACHTQCY